MSKISTLQYPPAHVVASSHDCLNRKLLGPDRLFKSGLSNKLFSGAACGMIVAGDEIRRDNERPNRGKFPHSQYVAWLKQYGYHVDRHRHPSARAVDGSSLFDAASITKSVPVALLVLWAVSQKLIRLEDPIRRFFPAMKVKGRECPTIKDLLTYNVDLELGHLQSPYHQYAPGQLETELRKASVTSHTGFRYSNYPPILLTLILELITSKPIGVLARDVLFGPLSLDCQMRGMECQQEVMSTGKHSRYVSTEIPSDADVAIAGVPHDEFTRESGLLGAAGLFCTGKDMLMILKFLLQNGSINGRQVIHESLIKQLGKNQHEFGTGFGLGFGLWTEFARGYDPMHDIMFRIDPLYAEGAFFKAGFTGGIIACFPRLRTGVAILTNAVYPRREDPQQVLRFRYCAIMQCLSGYVPSDIHQVWNTSSPKKARR